MNADARLLRNPLVALAPTDDGYLAYDTTHDRLHRLNPAAALIVELCDGTRTTAALIADLAPLVADDAQAGCARWIARAIQDDLLKMLAPGTSGPEAPAADFFAARASRLRREGHVLAAFVCQHHATLQMADAADRWAALGELAHIIGRREDARDAYEEYLRLAPGDAEVEHILVSLRGDPTPPRAPDECIVQLYARFAEFYERNMRKDLEYRAPEALADALHRQIGDSAALDVLELGCGTGLAGRHLRKLARRLVGIDLSPDMAMRATATGVYDVIDVAEITEWLTRHGEPRFDVIAACDTLIYFGDLRQVLVPVANRLHAGGMFAFTVERGEDAPFRLTDSGRYVHSEAHIADSAADAGFCVVSIDGTVLRYEYGEPVEGLVVVLRVATGT
jgi:predicted TPR repeat methyltransferase